MCYDVIYHPFPINPKNLKTLVVDSPCITNMYVESWLEICMISVWFDQLKFYL